VTFLFTDIEGSTRLFRDHVEQYPALLNRHRALMRGVWPDFDGVELNTEGDGTLVVFASAAAAVAAVVAAQRALTAEPWPVPVKVRMGAHTGLAHPMDGDYIALAVHQAARVSAAAHGSQVIVTADTAAAAGDVPGVRLGSLGQYRLRDFERPVALFQVLADGLPTHFPAVRAIAAEGHNLSRPPTSFVGREREMADVEHALAPGALVTLVGPGGVGKSRLALEVGLRVLTNWPQGVWRVAVDDLADPSALLPAVADVLAVSLTGPDQLGEIAAGLSDRRLLLLLDGCEQHVAAVAALAQALRDGGRVGLLVTSREPLHVTGEVVRRLRPLPVRALPERDGLPAAAALYIDRVRNLDPAFVATEQNTAAITTLMARLDGLPLAVEIAAGSAAAFTPDQVLAGLDDGLATLRSRDRSVPTRHRSIEAMLAWSEQSLSEPERLVFLRLGVFSGSFTLADVRAVAAADPVRSEQVPDHLWSLVDRSLVMADTAAGGSRYRMLELVRTFARNRLDGDERAGAVRRAGQWYRGLLGPELSSDQTWIGRAAGELDNLRGLIPQLVATGSPADHEAAAALAVSVLRYHDGVQSYRGGIDEGRHWLATIEPTPSLVALQTLVATLHLRLGEHSQARSLVARAARLRDDVGAPDWDEVGVERTLGELALRHGDAERAAALAREALARPLSPRSQARMQNLLGIALAEAGDLVAAGSAFAAELAAADRLGDELLVTRAHANAAELALRVGDVTSAARHQRACLARATVLGQPVFVAYALIVAATLAVPDAPAEAVALLASAERILVEAGHRLYVQDEARVRRVQAEAMAPLDETAYRRAQDQGRSWGVQDASRRADEVLARFSTS
jgi:predicted ATPase/class 3 adenylate cyclase